MVQYHNGNYHTQHVNRSVFRGGEERLGYWFRITHGDVGGELATVDNSSDVFSRLQTGVYLSSLDCYLV